MIKEQILPPTHRRLGLTAPQWTEKLDSLQSVDHLAAYAAGVRAITDELARSKAFVEQLSTDVEAFAAASFSHEEDRKRKQSDLSTARRELAVLSREISEEESLRKTAITRAGQLAEEDLMLRDSTFRELGQRIKLLQAAHQQAQDMQTAAGELHTAFGQLLELDQRLRALPADREQLEQSVRRLQQDAQAAQRECDDLASPLQQQADQYANAVHRAEQAASALAAAKRLHDAYLLEHPPQAEFDPASNTGSPSPLDAEYARLQEESQQAQAQLRTATAPYEAVKQRSEETKRKAELLQQQIAEARQKQESLAQQEFNLQRELSQAQDRLRPVSENLKTLAHRLQTAMQPLAWKITLPSLADLQIPRLDQGSHGRTRLPSEHGRSMSSHSDSHGMTMLTDFIHALQEQAKKLDRDLSSSETTWKKSWTNHCHELLGEQLARDVCSPSQ